MRKIVFVIGTALALLLSGNLYAQIKIPKTVKSVEQSLDEKVNDNFFSKQILQALDPGESFTSTDKLQQLLGNNSSFVENVVEVSGSDVPEDEKTTAIDSLKNNRLEFIENLLGEGKAAEYYNLVKDKVEPLVEKYKMAKLFL